ncbi:MAG: hypothetical protein ACRDKH_06320, partial [Solirubrobacterales bacterium]
ELGDRFGSLPEPVRSMLDLQRVRIELAAAGAGTVEFRAGNLRASPLELDSEEVSALQEQLPEAIYRWREKTLAVPVPDDAGARLAALLKLVEGLGPPSPAATDSAAGSTAAV